jgi:hypothetical protein
MLRHEVKVDVTCRAGEQSMVCGLRHMCGAWVWGLLASLGMLHSTYHSLRCCHPGSEALPYRYGI